MLFDVDTTVQMVHDGTYSTSCPAELVKLLVDNPNIYIEENTISETQWTPWVSLKAQGDSRDKNGLNVYLGFDTLVNIKKILVCLNLSFCN